MKIRRDGSAVLSFALTMHMSDGGELPTDSAVDGPDLPSSLLAGDVIIPQRGCVALALLNAGG